MGYRGRPGWHVVLEGRLPIGSQLRICFAERISCLNSGKLRFFTSLSLFALSSLVCIYSCILSVEILHHLSWIRSPRGGWLLGPQGRSIRSLRLLSLNRLRCLVLSLRSYLGCFKRRYSRWRLSWESWLRWVPTKVDLLRFDFYRRISNSLVGAAATL